MVPSGTLSSLCRLPPQSLCRRPLCCSPNVFRSCLPVTESRFTLSLLLFWCQHINYFAVASWQYSHGQKKICWCPSLTFLLSRAFFSTNSFVRNIWKLITNQLISRPRWLAWVRLRPSMLWLLARVFFFFFVIGSQKLNCIFSHSNNLHLTWPTCNHLPHFSYCICKRKTCVIFKK